MIALHEPLFKKNEWKYVKSCIDRQWVSSAGEYVKIFEKKIASYTRAKYAVACVNGTSALQVSLRLVGVKENDEVIVPSMTFIAPVNAIRYNNAIPIFMDSNESYTIDVKKVTEFLKNNTKTILKKTNKGKTKITINKKTGNRISSIIIVHLFGNAVDVEKLESLCKQKNISLVEDAAESLGTFYTKGKFKNKHTGTVGKIGCLSFNGNKIITAGGGGMILTNDKKIAEKAKYLTTQAKDDPIYSIHNEIGYNFRLTNLQAALGIAQLQSLPEYILKKRKIHEKYKNQISKIVGFSISNSPIYAKSNHWLNIIKINKKITKKKLLKIIFFFKKNKIEVRPVWYPIHLQKQYEKFQTYKLTNTMKIYQNRLCLPSSPSLTNKELSYICSKFKTLSRKEFKI